MVSVYSYEESKDVAKAVGEYILDLQDKTLENSEEFNVAISGGSLGKVLKAALIDDEANSKRVQWAKWKVYFSDERLVPLDHEDSNYGLFNELVLKNLAHHLVKGPVIFTINESLIHESDTANDSTIASEYAKFLPESLDLILLGCGPDGHTCSLFPGHKLLKEEKLKVASISDSPKPPPRRITITFPVLRDAKNIAFVAEGAGKSEILKEIFGEKKSELPSELVNELTGVPVSWFVNDAAINGVPVKSLKYK